MGTCFFIGHHTAPESIRHRLADAIEQTIVQHGVSHFIVGGYGSFDAMAAGEVKKARQRHPDITLQLLLPYHPAQRPIPVPDGFDSSFYPFEAPVPPRLAIVKANRWMVDHCDCLIAYAASPGNARSLLDYACRQAKKRPLHLRNLADPSS